MKPKRLLDYPISLLDIPPYDKNYMVDINQQRIHCDHVYSCLKKQWGRVSNELKESKKYLTN